MNPFRNIFKRKVQNSADSHNFVGAPSFRYVNPAYTNHYHSEEYASAYPNIRAIANEYMTVLPKAIDGNGKTVANNPIVTALYHPNQLDSVVSFNEKIAVTTLTQKKTYILVWRNEDGEARPGGDFGFKGKNIAGFTFLENPGITRRDGITYYNIGAQYFTENEVMVLTGGTDPNDLYGGFSPTDAAVRWITLDDYIADFQKGFFENNAIPTGMFKIIAPTVEEYNNTVDTLQARHRGAGNNGNVTYSHQPIDPNSGKPAEAQIEWIPFQQSNKDIDFKSLFEQANKRIDTAYGVPQIVKGVDDAATYANAQVAEAGFAKRAVLPLLVRNYSQITHELNRITGGIGVAITFNYEIPAVADAEKVEAETKVLEMSIIKGLTSGEGGVYTLGSVVDAFDLSPRYKLLSTTDDKALIENDKPEVDEGNEVETAPNPDKIDGVTPVNEAANSKNPKAKITDEEKIYRIARQYMKAQVDRVVSEFDEEASNDLQPEPSDDEEAAFITAMVAAVVPILIANGEVGFEIGRQLLIDADVNADLVQEYTITDGTRDNYAAYVRRVGDSYGSETAESIRKILLSSANQGLNKAETKKLLKNIMNTDEYRIERLAKTELNRSQAIGSVDGVKTIQDQTGIELEKSLFHPRGAKCEYCKALEGVWVKVDQPLIAYGQSVIGVDGGILVNDFTDNDGFDPHPNGGGVPTYRVVK